MSVLFVDLVGSTAIEESLPAEDSRELLSGYFEVARRVVDLHGGRVEKFIGDAVMAVWGSPVAREDDAERAVRAALELVSAVAGYGETSGQPQLRSRAGVVTGRAATWASRDEGLVVGDMVNTASRLQSAAEPGEVLVDDRTRRSTAAAVAYIDRGQHGLRGKSQRVRVWKAERVVAGVGGSMRLDGLEADLLGRSRDLAVIKELLHATMEDGRARLVVVSGAAGSGKSRLTWEFEKYVDGISQTVLWHRGQCSSYGEGNAYRALAEIVRQRLGIAQADDTDAVTATLADQLQLWVPDEEERSFVRGRLAALLGAATGTIEPAELFAGWRLFFERLATIQPVVLVVEDLHWADGGLLNFLDHLLGWSAGMPILVLTTARPELAEQRPTWPIGRRSSTLLHLQPLPDGAIDELVRRLVPNISATLAQRVVDRAAGIPLFAVETVRSLVDHGVVVVRDSTYTQVGDVEELDIPGSLISLIAARIDALPAAERTLTQGLAVLGASFPGASVGAVAGEAEQDVAELLRSLVRKEFLTVRSDPLSPERGHYAFTHDLVRRVAYDALPRRMRKSRHLAVARHLVATLPRDGEDVAEAVADHYHEAYIAARDDPDSGAHRAEAVAAYERAGRRAAELGAPDSAERAFRSAAELVTDEGARGVLLEAAADQAYQAGSFAHALELFERAETGQQQGASAKPPSAHLAAKRGRTLHSLGRVPEALEVMTAALRETDGIADFEGRAHLHGRLSRVLIDTGRLAEALEHAETAEELAARSGAVAAMATTLESQGMIREFLGDHEGAVGAYTVAVALATQHGLRLAEDTARTNLAWALLVGDDKRSLDAILEGLQTSRQLGDHNGQAESLDLLAVHQLFVGEWPEAERCATEAVQQHTHDHILAEGFTGITRCELDLFQGRPIRSELLSIADRLADDDPDSRRMAEAAQALLALSQGETRAACLLAMEAARDCLNSLGPRDQVFRLTWPLALETALESGLLDEAERAMSMVADPTDRRIPPYIAAQRSRYGALLVAARDGTDGVTTNLESALGQFDALGYPYWFARAQLDLGRWLATGGRVDEARPLLTAAAETFGRLDARPVLERAKVALSSLATLRAGTHSAGGRNSGR